MRRCWSFTRSLSTTLPGTRKLSPETVSLYKQTFAYVQRFTRETYKAPDIPMKQLDYSFVIRLDQYLLRKGLKRNTVNKHHSRFRHTRHRSAVNAMAHMLAALTAYCFYDGKPSVFIPLNQQLLIA